MTDLGVLFVLAPVAAPIVAGASWLALFRWRWPRRVVAGLFALATLAAAGAVFWVAYIGQHPSWGGLRPDLLGATGGLAAIVSILFASLGLGERPAAERPLLVAGLAASASAVVAAAYAENLVLLAVALVVPTVATGAVASAGGRADPRGLVSLALADVAAAAGLTVVLARTGSTVLGTSTGLGVALILAGAAVKAGAVPGLGAARLLAAGGPAGPMAGALRGQAVVLAAVGGLAIAGAEEMSALAITAAVAVLAGGLVAVAASTERGVVAGSVATGSAVLFVALGLGGGVGARAFLVLFPALILSAGAAQALLAAPGAQPRWDRRGRWLLNAAGVAAAGVAFGSLAGIPPGGGFPGTWLAVSLAGSRAEALPAYFLLAAGVLLGLALAMAAAVPLLRVPRARWGPAVAATAAALALVYAGAQPVRLGIGWWLRIEEALRLPAVLPASGAPALPPVGGVDLVLALAPAALLVALVVAVGRGVRRTGSRFVPVVRMVAPSSHGFPSEGSRWWRRPVAAASRLRARLGPALRPRTVMVVAAVVEAAALTLAIRLLILGIDVGFL